MLELMVVEGVSDLEAEAEVELGVEVVGVVEDTTAAELDETTEEEVVDCTGILDD